MIKKVKEFCAIDPGKSGAVVYLNEKGEYELWPMPLNLHGEPCYDGVWDTLERFSCPVLLERAVPFKMGTKSAFNYGRGFAALEIACMLHEQPVTYIEPAKWTKVMHQGIMGDLKAKDKSLIALQRLYPAIYNEMPRNKNGKLHDGMVDAILIAGYGLRCL